MKWFKTIFAVMALSFMHIYAQPEPEFLKNFTKVKTIQLDEKASIKFFRSIDFDKSGKILLTEAAKVYLFKPDGKLIRELKSDDCHPGIKWKPFNAIFKQDGEILIQNTFPGSMRFKNDGSCLKKLDDTFILPGYLISSFTNGFFVTFNNYMIAGAYPFNVYDKDGKEQNKFGKYQEEFKNFIKQMVTLSYGGMVVDKNDIIYKANFNSAEIFKFDKTGKSLGSIFRKPDRYIQLRDDIPTLQFPKVNFRDKQDVAKNKKDIDKFKKDTEKFSECYYSEKLFMLDSDLLMLVYLIGDDHGIQIFNTNGKYLLNNDLKIGKMSRNFYAKNGYFYIVVEPDLNNSKITNPSLEVYKYTGKRK